MTDKNITSYKLRPAARKDLEGIWQRTVRKWSVSQAEKYLRMLDEAFKLIVQDPRLDRERKELSPPVRIKRAGSHLIVYLIAETYIDIIRIRHERENWSNDPLDD